MLRKKARLTSAEVREIIKNGRQARLGTLSAKFTKGSSAKAAVVVSAKVAKSAVLRNRLRRAAYLVLRASLPENVHVVFFLHEPVLDKNKLTALCLKLI